MTGLFLLLSFAVISLVTPALGINEQSIRNNANLLGVAPYMKPAWIAPFDPTVSASYTALNDTFETGLEGWSLRVLGNGSSVTQGGLAPGQGYANTTGYKIAYNHSDPMKSYPHTTILLEKEFQHKSSTAAGVAFGFAMRVALKNLGANSSIEFSMNLVNPQGTINQMYPYLNTFQKIELITDSSDWQSTPISPTLGAFFTPFLFATFKGAGTYKVNFNVTISDPNPGDTTQVEIYLDNPGLLIYGNAFGVLGTDNSSYDIFAEFLFGTRISFLVGILATFLIVGIGLLTGLFSGYVGGLTDEFITRIIDFILILPSLPLLIVLAFVFSSSGGITIWTIIFVLGILGWPGVARIVRSQVLSVKERSFVEAARALGASRLHIMSKHIFPNVLGLVYALAAGAVGGAILSEAALSFLGLGDPTAITWGQMLHQAEINGGLSTLAWWWVVPPGLGIALLSVSFIFIGHALDEVFNPKLRGR